MDGNKWGHADTSEARGEPRQFGWEPRLSQCVFLRVYNTQGIVYTLPLTPELLLGEHF